jgi:hypothetical protein
LLGARRARPAAVGRARADKTLVVGSGPRRNVARRGVTEPTAGLAAEAGIAVFRIAFERWVDETNEQSLSQPIKDSFAELKSVTGGESSGRR